jgi:hypothetical protein
MKNNPKCPYFKDLLLIMGYEFEHFIVERNGDDLHGLL